MGLYNVVPITLTTGDGAISDSMIEVDLMIPNGTLDNFAASPTIPEGESVTEGQAISAELSGIGNATLGFNYSFDTSETAGSSFNDFSFFSVGSSINLIAFDNKGAAPATGTINIDLSSVSPGDKIGIGVLDEQDMVGTSTLSVSDVTLALSNGPGTLGTPTDADIETFLGVTSGTLDGIGNGDVTEGSAALVGQEVTFKAGQSLTIDYTFITTEGFNSTFNDFAFFSLGFQETGASTEYVFELGDPGTPGYGSVTLTAGRDFVAGTYDIGVGVVDVGNTIGDSNLIVSDFMIAEYQS